MNEFEPRSAQGVALQVYIDVLDNLSDARESGDDHAVRRASAEAERTKREWHRLVRRADEALRKRSE